MTDLPTPPAEGTDGMLPAVPGSVSSEPLHVYDWLDQPAADENERLAKEWLEQFVKQPLEKDHDWMDSRALYCKYRGEIYRCVGASRMGDVWLTSKLLPDGYEKRVCVDELSEWMRVDLVNAPDPKPPRRRSAMMMGLIAGAACLAGGLPGFGGGPLAADIRNDPNREKTPEDLERMAAAQRKRDRKAARNGPQNAPV